MHRRRSAWLLMAASLLCARPAAAASLTELLQATPAPPADVAQARSWVLDGQVVAPEIVTLESNLRAAHAAALAAASGSAADEPAASANPAADSAAVLAAVAAGRAYLAANADANAPAAVLGARVKWLASRFSGLLRRVEGTDRAAEVRSQELAAYRALFADWQSKRAPILTRAQMELAAAGDPAAIQSAGNRAAIHRYRAAMLDEVDVLLGLTRYSVERAAGLPSAEPSSVEPSANTLWDLMSNPRQRPRP